MSVVLGDKGEEDATRPNIKTRLIPYLELRADSIGDTKFDVTLLASCWDPLTNRGWAVRSLRVAGELELTNELNQDRQK